MGLQAIFPLALGLTASASASTLRRSPADSFLSFPVVHERGQDAPVLLRRDNEVTLFNRSTIAYMVQLNVGTPPQEIRVQLDTGSDELWVDPDCSMVSNSASADFCSSLGQYDPSQSSTVVDQEATKELSYGIGTVQIQYVSDHISIPGTNGAKLQNVIFGVAAASKDAAVPIMGVGFGKGVNLEYNNMVDEMVAQGVANSHAFTVALGPSSQNNGGVVIFGGVDTKKFVGKLQAFENLPPQTGEEGLWRYWIQLDSVGVTKSGGGSSVYQNSGTPIVIDSGSSYSYLPSNVISKLTADFNGDMDSDGNVQVPCSVLQQGGTVDFTFGTLTIHVPIVEFVRQLDQNVCVLGAMPADGTPLLGDTFMRSAYVVFDQDHQQIFMAPYANCGTDEQSLPATPGAAGSFTGQCTAKNTASGNPINRVWVPLVGLVGMQMIMALL